MLYPSFLWTTPCGIIESLVPQVVHTLVQLLILLRSFRSGDVVLFVRATPTQIH